MEPMVVGECTSVPGTMESSHLLATLSNLMTSCLSILVSKRQTHRYRERDIERERQRERDRETKIEELE